MTAIDEYEPSASLRSALTTEAAGIPVAPASVDRIRQRGRRRQRRQRGVLAALAVVVLVAAGAAVVAAAGGPNHDSESVHAGQPEITVPAGTAPQPLLVPGLQTGMQREEEGLEEFDGLSQVDELAPDGSRTPWWYREEGSDWAVQPGVELTDGRRFGVASGEMGSPVDGQYAVAEISRAGTTMDQHVLDLPAAREGWQAGAGLISASGPELFIGWDAREVPPEDQPEGVPFSLDEESMVLAYDVQTQALRTVLPRAHRSGVHVAGDVLVELGDDRCSLVVRADLGEGPSRTVSSACLDGPLSVTSLEAVSPDGRYAVVRRLSLNGGPGEEAYLVIDLREGVPDEPAYVLTAESPVPFHEVAWTGPSTLSIGIVTDNPDVEDVEVPPGTNGLTIVPVRYRERS